LSCLDAPAVTVKIHDGLLQFRRDRGDEFCDFRCPPPAFLVRDPRRFDGLQCRTAGDFLEAISLVHQGFDPVLN
jgi:hypothetical protein